MSEVPTSNMSVPYRSRGAVGAQSTFIARQVLLPVQQFIYTAGRYSAVLMVATVAALAWANSPWKDTYFHFWETKVTVDLVVITVSESIHHWVNDALMTIFFFLVGLEVKHELVAGKLANPKSAALPAIAALGGMVVPAGIYMALNGGSAAFSGWGIPMATDIAFALGVLTLLGNRIPSELRVILLALAIVDDIGAILVIAVFYTEGLSLAALGVAGVVLAIIVAMNRLGFRAIPGYVLVGAVFWLAVFATGVHATIAGVILGVLTPARPYLSTELFTRRMESLMAKFKGAAARDDHQDMEDALGAIEETTVSTEAPVERLERSLAPWSNYLILPIFALGNAGIVLSSDALDAALTSSATFGVVLGLVIGKPVGIFLFSFLAVKLRIGSLPTSVTWSQMLGMGMIAGIGFTVALFINGLAFTDQALVDESKMGILAASLIAGVIGYAFLMFTTRGRRYEEHVVTGH